MPGMNGTGPLGNRGRGLGRGQMMGQGRGFGGRGYCRMYGANLPQDTPQDWMQKKLDALTREVAELKARLGEKE